MPSSSSARVGVVICVATRPASGRNSKLPSLQPSSRNNAFSPSTAPVAAWTTSPSRRCTRPRTARPSEVAPRAARSCRCADSGGRAGAGPRAGSATADPRRPRALPAPPHPVRIHAPPARRRGRPPHRHRRRRRPSTRPTLRRRPRAARRRRRSARDACGGWRAGSRPALAASISSSGSAVTSTSGTSRRAVSSAAAPCGQIASRSRERRTPRAGARRVPGWHRRSRPGGSRLLPAC